MKNKASPIGITRVNDLNIQRGNRATKKHKYLASLIKK